MQTMTIQWIAKQNLVNGVKNLGKDVSVTNDKIQKTHKIGFTAFAIIVGKRDFKNRLQ